MEDKNYYNKIVILFIATFANLFLLWFFMIRPEGLDWISSQIVHQVSPYAVSETKNGLIINNVVMGYEFSLPKGFKTAGARNLTVYLETDGRKKCEIKHYYVQANKVEKLISDDNKVVYLLNNARLIFEPIGAAEEKTLCAKYLKQIEASLMIN